MNPELIMFDLDGTLSDSARSIVSSLRYAFTVNGLPPLDAATEHAVLGPPFHESLPAHIGAVPLADVSAAYREHYLGGSMFDTTVFAGITDVLDAIQAAGIPMAVATSKPEFYAVSIVEHLGLAGYFTTIGGDVPEATGTKADVIGRVLNRMGKPDPGTVLMVGDRRHDVEGARAHGIDCIAVEWGYAVPGELPAANPRTIVATPIDLLACVELTTFEQAL
ncbi:MAG: HAD hydrolase-like protein [Jatrophihabitantaceae bacterium]